MDEEDVAPLGSVLKQLVAEDLEVMSLEMLAERITILRHEIARAEQAIEDKNDVRAAAETLFKS
ncbi:MAG: DUF1192 domain-containing protein [Kordiimonas sp.]|nr:DUF1192 domain-containing protein [Kordiimonas sp.]|tara:strand:+ start:542 stop:733 length:192 start_codon:yes stop_codon:yes gene_type:complete